MQGQLLTVRQVAEWLVVSERKVMDLAREGKLPGYKVEKDWRFARHDIESYLAAQRNRQAAGDPPV